MQPPSSVRYREVRFQLSEEPASKADFGIKAAVRVMETASASGQICPCPLVFTTQIQVITPNTVVGISGFPSGGKGGSALPLPLLPPKGDALCQVFVDEVRQISLNLDMWRLAWLRRVNRDLGNEIADRRLCLL